MSHCAFQSVVFIPGALAMLALAGCSDGSSEPNPARLWLALRGGETEIQLSAVEPGYY